MTRSRDPERGGMEVMKAFHFLGLLLISFIIFIFTNAFPGQGLATTDGEGGYVKALWIADTRGVFKLRGDDGTTLLAGLGIRQTRAVAVDPERQTVWSHGGNQILAHDFSGTLRFMTFLPAGMATDEDAREEEKEREDDQGDEEVEHPLLTVDTADGGVWLALGRRLLRFDVQGVPGPDVRFDWTITGMTYDAPDHRLWVAGREGAFAFDANGRQVAALAQGDRVRDLSHDGTRLWLLLEAAIQAIDPQGEVHLQRPLTLKGGGWRRMAADGSGGVWLLGKKKILRIDSRGDETASADPLEGKEKLEMLSVDPSEGSIWVASAHRLVHVGGNGAILQTLQFKGDDKEVGRKGEQGKKGEKDKGNNGNKKEPAAPVTPQRMRALAFYADVTPPVLTVTTPGADSWINHSKPEISLNYSDSGSGVNPETLLLTVDETTLAVHCELRADGATCTPDDALSEGPVTLSARIGDQAGNLSAKTEVTFTIDTVPPEIRIETPTDRTLTNQPRQTLRATISEPVTATLNGEALSLGPDLLVRHEVVLQEGDNRLELRVVDRAGNDSLTAVTVILDTLPPPAANLETIVIGASVAGEVKLSGTAGSVEAGAQVQISNRVNGASVTVAADATGAFATRIAANPGEGLTLVVTDGAGNAGSAVETAVPGVDDGLPPDPATVAPPLQGSIPTQMHDAAAFLYSGPDPIQKGVTPEAMEPRRSVVLRGLVSTREGAPLPGVKVTIKDHPEFGHTLSRSDGMFDMAVNGGGHLVVEYALPDHLPAQRQIQTEWGDYYWLPDVSLVALDPEVTTVTLGPDAPLQTARGSEVTDADGPRRATILFPPGVTAEMTLPDGTTQPLTTLNVRATEYTVGPGGPKAMPAELPTNTAYTYAVELSADEALAAGASSIRFSAPVPIYLENFIDFPVGIPVPSGYYDRDRATWIPEPDGRVIGIVGVVDGRAQLDLKGDGLPATATDLAALGVTDAELVQLALLYRPGQSLWRVPLAHFSPWDFNWPAAPPNGSTPPQTPAPQPSEGKNKPDDPCIQKGSIIECENQVLGESVPIVGTPFSLNYRSDRVLGRKTSRILDIPLTDAALPAQLKSIQLELLINGRRITRSFTPEPNLTHRFEWDGLDVHGREIYGKQPIRVRIGYVYPLTYGRTRDELDKNFGQYLGAGTLSRSRKDMTGTMWKVWKSEIDGHYATQGVKLGGWTLSAHHTLDRGTLYKGTGETRSAMEERSVLRLVAGGGDKTLTDGIAARSFQSNRIKDMVADAEGGIYFTEINNDTVWKITPYGVVVRVAGSESSWGFSGDGGPARDAKLSGPSALSIGPDGSLFIADTYNGRIRKVNKAGIITTVAGNGGWLNTGDNGPALAAQFGNPVGVAVGPDGSVFIYDDGYNRIRKVTPDGIITTVVGGGQKGGDYIPALEYFLETPSDGVRIGPDGLLYIADYNKDRIYKLRTDGILVTVAGDGLAKYGTWFEHDGKRATDVSLISPRGLAFAPEGAFFFIDSSSIRPYHRAGIRKVNTDGTIRTVAGNGKYPNVIIPDGSRSLASAMKPHIVAFGPDRKVYFQDIESSRIYQVDISAFGLDSEVISVAEPNGEYVHGFDKFQRHQKTVDSRTGKDVYRFEYNAAGLLVRIIDGDGEVTVIERTGKTPTAIVAADGQRTRLALDGKGYLAAITNPNGETHRFTSTPDGLLLTATTPRGHRSTFIYDEMGRLIRDENPGGGHLTLSREETADGHVAALTSALGRANRYLVETAVNGRRVRRTIGADGTVTEQYQEVDGATRTTMADGTVMSRKEAPDPRFGMAAPVDAEVTLATPGGLVRKVTRERQ
ncbi:MAG: hypothetical protein HQL84_15910, partial [Magnetococcales bacterium]|nr:hypothetical protein [Magnetococcales bacterium]MBF0151507.1 hypothetical protein [Magnetococcales bacterium]